MANLVAGRSYLASPTDFDQLVLKDVLAIDRLEYVGDDLSAKNTRELIGLASQKPLGETRLLVIERADRMSEIVQNTLLKLLEEPPSQLIIILVTEHPEKLITTVGSRLEKLTKTSSKATLSNGETAFDIKELEALKDRPALIEKLTGWRDELHHQLLNSGKKTWAERLVLVDQALTRLEANCSRKLVLDDLYLQTGEISDNE
ncbi:MAG TPA: hypothetical protein VMQ44_03780 [Candidatus Saccharimonadales bacterium]|nr:hypothetical protein [Candidatus Saccharimonadales bacterium]